MSEKSTNKVLVIAFIILAVCAVAATGFFVYKHIASSSDSKIADDTYAATKKYLNLKTDSTADEKNQALDDLLAYEDKFAKDSFYYSQLNIYKANLYKDLNDVENERKSLENVVANAKDNNYLLQVALYRLAVSKDDALENEGAFENYKTIWEKFGKDCVYSQMSLFSMFRLKYAAGETEEAKKYSDILSENYPGSVLSEFAKSLF